MPTKARGTSRSARKALRSAAIPAPDRRPRNAQESRRLLVEAAARIFNTDGFHGTDTNRIAKAAGYTPGTFYTHFQDKREIFLEVYRGWVDAELLDIAAGFDLKSQDDGKRLAKIVVGYHKKWKIFRASLRALYAIDPEVRTARLAQRARQIDAIAAISVGAGREPLARSLIFSNLLTVEAICDCIADGNLEIVRIKESEMFQILAENISRLHAALRD